MMFIPQLVEICRKILANILLEKMLPYLSPSKKPENVCENWWGGFFYTKIRDELGGNDQNVALCAKKGEIA